MKAIRLLGALVLIAGACLTGRAVYMHAKAELAGILVRRAWEESVRTGKPHAPWPWADTHPVARLRIPRLGYDEIVLEGATPRTLAFGPARLLSGARIGEPGNVVLAGHRTSWFRRLEGIAPNDTIQVEWFDTRHGGLQQRAYTVNTISVTKPEDVALLGPTPQDALTLITCYPFGRGPRSPQRFIVRASPQENQRLTTEARSHGEKTLAADSRRWTLIGSKGRCSRRS
ncbi:MAG: class GN sortase [Acidobacteriia bacterium]|nr:class GN sortase [Terriglobia bacterium]